MLQTSEVPLLRKMIESELAVDKETWVARPNAAARSSNRIPDDAEKFDIDACTEVFDRF